MSITIQLELPDALAREARASGLLEAHRLEALLSQELQRERTGKEWARKVRKWTWPKDEPISMDEI